MKKHRWLLLLFVIFAVIYVLQIITIPPDEASLSRFGISYTTAQIIRTTLAIPVFVIWAIALAGYVKSRRYAELLKSTHEYKSWQSISAGLLCMAISLPVSSIVSSWTSALYHDNPSLTPKMVIINNYVALAGIAVSTYFIYVGTKRLFNNAIVKRDKWSYGPVYLLAILIISSLFVYMNLSNPARQFPTATTPVAAFYLPDWLLMITILVPYIAVWYAGIKSVEFMHAYQTYEHGKIYKSSLRSFAVGLAAVVLSWASIRFFVVIVTAYNVNTLKYILTLIYFLLIITGVGFTFIARGAIKLSKIEEA